MESQTLHCSALAAEGLFRLSDEKEHTVSQELDFDGGRVVQFHLGVLSAYSYLLCSCDAAMLIDPGRDVENYGKYLEQNHIRLCGVFLTHLHSDFVAGHIEAGERFNVPVFIGRESHASFSHIAIDDEANFTLGRLRLHFFASPGHAEDGVCLSAGTRPEEPEMVFTGDALDVPEPLAADMDWLDHLASLPDEIRIYPGHGTLPEAGEPLTLGTERQRNRLFNPQAAGRIFHGGSGLHKESLRHINRSGPALVDWDNTFEETEPDASWSEPGNRVIDIRSYSRYAPGHVPCSLNIESNGRLEYWTARLFEPHEGELLLTGENFFELAEASGRLKAMGFNTKGFDFSKWKERAFPLKSSGLIDPEELSACLWSENPPLVVDVRTVREWQKSRLSGSVNKPLAELPGTWQTLPRDREIVLVCASGYRSAIAAGILEQGGFPSISLLEGGLGAWIASGKMLNTGKETSQTPVPSKCGIKSSTADSGS